MNYLKTFTVLVIAIIAGCATPPPQTFAPLPFDEVEYSALPTTGTGIVRGQVFAKTVGGDVKKGAGEKVVMFPATKYGDQRYFEQVIGGKLLSSSEDPRYINYVLVKITDGDGRFEFTGVPPGKFYVLSKVTWMAGDELQGGQIVAKIEAKNGTIIDAILSR